MGPRRLAVIAFALTVAICANAATTNESQVYRQKYLMELDQIIAGHREVGIALEKRYLAALADLKNKVQTQGNLKLTLAVIEETKRFDTSRSMPADDTPKTGFTDLQNLQAAYTQSRSRLDVEKARRVVNLVLQYDNALDGLQRQLTKEGRIDEATAVAKEREELKTSELFVSANRSVSQEVKDEPPKVAPWVSGEPPPQTAGGWVTLFDGAMLYGANLSPELVGSGKVKVENGALCIDGVTVHFDVHGQDVVVRARVKNVTAENLYLSVRGHDRSWYDGFNAGDSFGIGRGVRGVWKYISGGKSARRDDGFFDLELSAIGHKLTLKAEGKTVAEVTDGAMDDGLVGAGAFGGISLFKRIEVRVLDRTH